MQWLLKIIQIILVVFGGWFVCFFKKKKKLEFFRNSQFHLSLRATAAAIKSHCYLHGFDGFAAKFTQKF